ncbi:RND family efflux transporter MFP subunit [Polaromonas sp. CG_9.11]|nr:RND family efflux transporter MFP subunit [Polaromonas sp. CG_9.11]
MTRARSRSLRSRRGVVLRPEISGRITQLNFTDGQRVRRGQLLVQFDDQLPQAQILQSQAELSIAQANQKRNQELVAQNFISQRSLDESAAGLQVAQAKAALAKAMAARLKILAPFDGIIGIRQVNVGDYLKDGRNPGRAFGRRHRGQDWPAANPEGRDCRPGGEPEWRGRCHRSGNG